MSSEKTGGPSLGRRILVFILAMLLGMALLIGAVAMTIYIALNGVTVGQLMGNNGQPFLTDKGTVNLKDLTVMGALAELIAITNSLPGRTLNSLVQYYGINGELLSLMPEEYRTLDLGEVAANPVNAILNATTVGVILRTSDHVDLLTPHGYNKLKDRSITYLLLKDYDTFFEGVYVGDMLGVDLIENPDGTVTPIFKNPDKHSVNEYLAPYPLGKVFKAYGTGSSEFTAVMNELLSMVPMHTFIDPNSGFVYDAAKDLMLSDLFSLDDTEEHNLHLSTEKLMDNVTIGSILGYYENEDGVWCDKATDEPATGIEGALADVTVNELGSADFDLMDRVGNVYLGELMGLTRDPNDANKWLNEEGDALDDPIRETLAGKKIDALLHDDLSLESLGISDLLLADVLDYEKRADGWYDKNNEKVPAAMAAMLGFKVGELSSGIKTLYVGELIGFTVLKNEDGELCDENGDPLPEGADPIFVKGTAPNYEYPTGVMKSIAPLLVSELEESDAVSKRVQNTLVGDAMGYVYDENTEAWYKSSAINEENKVTGIFGTLANFKVSEMEDGVQDLSVADVLGYEKGEDGIYRDEDDNPATGILKILMASKISTLDKDTDNVYLGEIMGYTAYNTDTGLAFDKENDDASKLGFRKGEEGAYTYPEGPTSSFVTMKVKDLSDDEAIEGRIKTMSVGTAMGYKKVGDTWYEKYEGPDDLDNKKLTGIVKALADKPVEDMGSEMETMKVGTALGYEETADGWEDENGDSPEKMLASVIDTPVTELDGVLETLTIGKAMGYKEHNGTWYEVYSDDGNDDNDVKVSGVMGALADKNVNSLDSTIKTMTVGEAMGFKTEGSKLVDENGQEVKGVMKALADKPINALSSTIDDMTVGTAMGYEEHGGIWYEKYEGPGDTDNVEASNIMSALANKKVNDMGSSINTMSIADIMGYEKGEDGVWYEVYVNDDDPTNDVPVSGFMKLFGPDTLLTEIDQKTDDLTENATVGDFMDAGILKFSTTNQNKIDALFLLLYPSDPDKRNWKALTIDEFINTIIGNMNP